MLEFDFHATVGRFELHVAGRQEAPRMGLFGPTGCGKTTLLHCLAGLIRPREGSIRLGGRPLFDAARGLFVPPHRRRMGYVFQDGRLFPHLSVRRNIEYGRRGANGPALAELADVLDLGRLLDCLPGTLSGGERQRVALARALAAGPELMMMDEPLAMVDAGAKLRILPYLVRSYDVCHVPFVYVSHSLSEVMYLTDLAWHMSAGRIEACVPPRQLLSRLRGDVEAVSNILTGKIDRVPEGAGYAVASCGGLEIKVPGRGVRPGQRVSLALPARDVIVSTVRPAGLSARNVLVGRLLRLVAEEGIAWAEVQAADNQLVVELTAEAVGELGLQAGQDVHLVLKTHSIAVTPLSPNGPPADEG